MDSGSNDVKFCNGNNSSSFECLKVGVDKRDEQNRDTSLLLLSALKKGGIRGRRQRSRRKKVQWNDCNGNKLVEVLEFQPSDTSDSEDECDSRFWIRRHHAFAGCFFIFCGCLPFHRDNSQKSAGPL